MNSAQKLIVEGCRLWAPPPDLTCSQWVDRYFHLSSESSAAHGKATCLSFQREPLDTISDPRVVRTVIKGPTQLLKCLSLDTPIPTPSGWTDNGELIPGDVVFDEHGVPCNVTAVGPVYYGKKCFRVKFDDGCSLVADADHLWDVYRWQSPGDGRVLRTTAEMYLDHRAKTHIVKTRARYRVAVAGSLKLPEATLPVEPYVFGAWLGDGTSHEAALTCDLRDGLLDQVRLAGIKAVVASVDKRRPHVAKIALGKCRADKDKTLCLRGHSRTPENTINRSHGCKTCASLTLQARRGGYTIPNTNTLEYAETLSGDLFRLGVLRNKHIPDIYLRSSDQQRRSLLQGIMDTDGTCSKKGICLLSVTNERLARDTVKLVRSLGLKPTLTESRAKLKGKDCGPLYIVFFTAYFEDAPFRLDRKRSRLRSIDHPGTRPTECRRRSIFSIEEVESVPVRCISVDSESHLFLAGDGLIPTHNTFSQQAAIGYFAHTDPGPILVLLPGDQQARDFSKERIAPMIRDTPVLRKIFRESKGTSSESTITEKLFDGGLLAIAGAGSARNLASRSIRILLCDEVDKYLPTIEGSALVLARERLATFMHRAKEVDTCSPTVEGSAIDREYENSDQREFYVPCPDCGHMQSMMLKFYKQVRWQQRDENGVQLTREQQARTARYHCEACDLPWDDGIRLQAVERGEWRAHLPFEGVAGFWLSALYSPWKQLSEIVLKYLKAKDNPDDLRAFVNTNLAENWTDKGDAPEWEILLARREDYPPGVVPAGGLFVTIGADVHPDRIEAEAVAWGKDRQSWSIAYEIFEGRTSEEHVWREFEAFTQRAFPHGPSGALMYVARVFVDSGFATNDVYSWVRTQPADRVVAIKGDDKGALPVSQPSPVDIDIGGKKISNGLRIQTIKISFFKAGFYADLKKRPPTEEEIEQGATFPPGYCHFPKDARNYGDEHFKQLCAEQLVTRRNARTKRVKQEWQATRDRNEALDARVYARAAAWAFGLDTAQKIHWDALEASLKPVVLEPEPRPVPQPNYEAIREQEQPAPRAADTWTEPNRQRQPWIERRNWFR